MILYKGDYGWLVIIGGDYGMVGVICMMGEVVLCVGVGLVWVLICSENIVLLLIVWLELMVYELMMDFFIESLEWVDVVVIGFGLG